MQKKKRNHWVPQAYLRRFATDPAREKIWALSKEDGPPELKPIRKVAVRFYLYAPRDAHGVRDYAFEDKLASLEQFFAHPYWDVICNDMADLSWEPARKQIALLTAVMALRNPVHLEFMTSLHRQFVDFYSKLPSIPDTFEIKGKVYEIDKESWSAYRDADEDAIKRMWVEQVGSAVWLAELMLKMRWGMLVSEAPVFITTDNPVVMLHPSLKFRGLSNPETTLLFPLSPTRVLFMDNRHGEPDGQYYSCDDPASLNGQLWRNAIDHMFCHRDPHDVCAEMLASGERMGFTVAA